MRNEQAMLLSLLLEVSGDGYLASVPGIQGAFAEGDTMEEAVFNFYRQGRAMMPW